MHLRAIHIVNKSFITEAPKPSPQLGSNYKWRLYPWWVAALSFGLTIIVIALILTLTVARAESYKDWKAPPPLPKEKQVPIITGAMPEDWMPFVRIDGYDLKIAINPSTLRQYNLTSGQEISAKLMYEIIEHERNNTPQQPSGSRPLTQE